MPVTLEFLVDERTRAALRKLSRPEIDAAVVRGGTNFQILAARRLPEITQEKVHTRTGTMARSWRMYQSPDGVQIKFQNIARGRPWRGKRTPYAHFIEMGTRAHFVKPRFAKVLVWDKTGRPISAANVKASTVRARLAFDARGHNVRGIQPRKIFRTFLDRYWREWGVLVVDEFNRILSRR